MKKSPQILPQAECDLEELMDFFAGQGLRVAERFAEAVRKRWSSCLKCLSQAVSIQAVMRD